MRLVKAPPDPRVKQYYESKLLNSRGQPLTPSTCSSASAYTPSSAAWTPSRLSSPGGRSVASNATISTTYSSTFGGGASQSGFRTPGSAISHYSGASTPAAGGAPPRSGWTTPGTASSRYSVASSRMSDASVFGRTKDPEIHRGRDSILRGQIGPSIPRPKAASTRRLSSARTPKPSTPDFQKYSTSPRRLSVDETTPSVRLSKAGPAPPPAAVRRSSTSSAASGPAPSARASPAARLTSAGAPSPFRSSDPVVSSARPGAAKKKPPTAKPAALSLNLVPAKGSAPKAAAPVADEPRALDRNWDEEPDIDAEMVLVEPKAKPPLKPKVAFSEPEPAPESAPVVEPVQPAPELEPARQTQPEPQTQAQSQAAPAREPEPRPADAAPQQQAWTETTEQQPSTTAMAPRNRVASLARDATESRLQGDYDKAVQLCVQRLAYSRFAYPKTSVQMVSAHADLARNYAFKSCSKQAADHIGKALAIADAAGARPSLVSTLRSAGEQIASGDMNAAVATFKRMEAV